MAKNNEVLINFIVNARNNAKGTFADASKQLDALQDDFKSVNRELENYEKSVDSANKATAGQNKFFKEQTERVKDAVTNLRKYSASITRTLESVNSNIETLKNGNEKLLKSSEEMIRKNKSLSKSYKEIADAFDEAHDKTNALYEMRKKLNSISDGSVASDLRSMQREHAKLASALKISSKNLKKWIEVREEATRKNAEIEQQQKKDIQYYNDLERELKKTAVAYDKQQKAIEKNAEAARRARAENALGLKQQAAAQEEALKILEANKGVTELLDNTKQYFSLLERRRAKDYAEAVAINNQKEIDAIKEKIALTKQLIAEDEERERKLSITSDFDRDPFAIKRKSGIIHPPAGVVDKRNPLLGGFDKLDRDFDKLDVNIKETTRSANLLVRAIEKVSNGRIKFDNRDDSFRNLRGLTSELRGFGIAFAIKNVEALSSAAVGAVSGLTSLAASAIGAGAALGGALAAGAAQAIGPLSVLMATVGRVTAITKVVNLKQQIQEASNHTAQTNAAGKASDALAAAQERAADATRGITKAQKDYNDAVREAKRNLQDMRLEQMRANLALEDAKRNLSTALLGSDTAEIAEARLDYKEAKLKAQRASQDNRAAQRGGVGGQPGVVAARERLADANRQAAQASRALASAENGLAAAGDGATASQDRLNYMLSQLTSNERKLVKSVENIQNAYKKSFRRISDIIIGESSRSLDTVAKLFERKDLVDVFVGNAEAMAIAMRSMTSFMTSDRVINFVKIFTDLSTENIPKVTEGLINLGKAFINIASNSAGVFNIMLKDLVGITESIAKATRNSAEFFNNSLKDYEAWKKLLGSIWDLFKVIFEPARAEGVQMVVWAAEQIDKFVKTLQANPQALSQFFKDGVESSKQILRVIWEIGKALYQVFKPESVKALADFIVMILIPAFKQVILTIGFVTKLIQTFLSQEIPSRIARWVITVTLLTRAFQILQTAVRNILLAMAGFATYFAGTGLKGKVQMLVGAIILLSSILGTLGIGFEQINKLIHEHTRVATIAASAVAAFIAALAVQKVVAYGGAIATLTKLYKALTASQIAASATSLFGRGRGVPNMPGGGRVPSSPGSGMTGIFGGLKNMSKATKGIGVGSLIGGAAAAIGGNAVGGKTGSFISNAGAGAATGAGIGMMAGPWGAAIGGVVGGLAGLGTAYLSTKDKQEDFAKTTATTTQKINAQKQALIELRDLNYAERGSKLDYLDAQDEYRNARAEKARVKKQLKAQGMTDAEIRKDKQYIVAARARERAWLRLQQAKDSWTEARDKNESTRKEKLSGFKKEIAELQAEVKKLKKESDAAYRSYKKIHETANATRRKALKHLGDRGGYFAMFDANAVQKMNTPGDKLFNVQLGGELVAILGKEKDAKDKLNDANKRLAKSSERVAEGYKNLRTQGRHLGRSFGRLENDYISLANVIVTGTNDVFKEFGVTKRLDLISKKSGEKKASGGYVGKPGERGRDQVHTVLGRGEAVLNHNQQGIVNSALQNSGISGLGEVFQRTKGSYHYMASGGFAGMTPGIIRAAQTITKKFPGLQVTSGRRNRGGTSFHESGRAADIASFDTGLMRRAAQWIKTSSLARQLSEGIHNPNLSIKNGKTVPPGFWGADTWAGHADHIHIAIAGALGKISGGIASEFKGMKIPKITGSNSAIKDIFKKSAKIMTKEANKYAKKKIDALTTTESGSDYAVPRGNVRGWLAKALRITGHYTQQNLNALYGRAMQESSGNPRAINLWDSNAKAGTPSKGLLQTIDPTFNTYKMKGHGNIWNPVDNAIAAIRYMFARYGHIVGPSSTGYARGGFVGSFANGGTVPGSGAVPIVAHAGEWILNKGQQARAAAMAGMSREGLRKNLGFTGGPGSFAGGGVVPDYENSDSDYRADYRTIKRGSSGKKIEKRIDKALKAIRDLTADNGVIAQFATVIENFSNKLSNALKKASYAFDKVTGKGVKQMSDEAIAQQNVSNIEAAGKEQLSQIKKVREARRKARKVRTRALKERNKVSRDIEEDYDVDDLHELYDKAEERRAAGKSTTAVDAAIKRREAKLKKTSKGKKALKKLKAKNARAKRAKKGVKALSDAIDVMEANQADLAQQAYDAQYDYIQTQNSSSQERFDIANTDSEIYMAGSVSQGANASIKNAALTTRNNELDRIIDQLITLGGKDNEVKKLRQEQEQNRQEMHRNTIATIANTSQIKQNLVAFKSGVINTGVGIIKSLGALTGTTNNSLITSLLTGNKNNLINNRSNLISDLNKILSVKGIASIGANLSGESLVSTLVGLSSTNTLGWTEEEQNTFQSLTDALLNNEAAIIDNSQQLKDLNGNNDQGFSTYSWTAFRQAVFNGTGGLLPQYANSIPKMAVGGTIQREGLAYLHPAEVVLNKQQAQQWNGNTGNVELHITNPTEVVDPTYLGNKLMFELNNRGK